MGENEVVLREAQRNIYWKKKIFKEKFSFIDIFAIALYKLVNFKIFSIYNEVFDTLVINFRCQIWFAFLVSI